MIINIIMLIINILNKVLKLNEYDISYVLINILYKILNLNEYEY